MLKTLFYVQQKVVIRQPPLRTAQTFFELVAEQHERDERVLTFFYDTKKLEKKTLTTSV